MIRYFLVHSRNMRYNPPFHGEHGEFDQVALLHTSFNGPPLRLYQPDGRYNAYWTDVLVLIISPTPQPEGGEQPRPEHPHPHPA